MEERPILELLAWMLVAAVATAVVWKGSDLLESASARLSVYYQLPEVVQGAVIVAVGSSFPELATVIVSTSLHGAFELGVAAIIGSALFNVMVIPALCSLATKEPLFTNRDLVYKEAQFYIISVAVLLLMFSFAVIYNPVESDDSLIRGEVSRALALVPIALYGVYLMMQYQDAVDFTVEEDCSHITPGREWLSLAIGLGLILLGVEALVRAALNFGDILNTPNFIWGLTVVAAGTSVPDAFVSIQAARRGRGITSTANVLGSNIFDLLCCIPIGVLIAGAVVINYSVAAPLMAALALATIILFAMMRRQMSLSRNESWLLLALYGLFVGLIIAESFQALDLIPDFPPTS